MSYLFQQKRVECLPKLPAPVKNLPFKLATTSFIFRDRIVPNVEKLGKLFDEIELLLFESIPFVPKGEGATGKVRSVDPVEVLPSREEIQRLSELSELLDVTYNIHLPVDVSLTDRSRAKRLTAIDVVKEVVELCTPLNPTTHTLHLDFNIDCSEQDHLNRWRDLTGESLELLSSSIPDPSSISIETLHYPFEYVSDIVDQSGMSICVDAGHLILHGYSIDELFDRYGAQIPLIHLHGVDFSSGIPKDHQSIDKTPDDLMASTLNVMRGFKGVVSLEVFNYEDLYSSLTFLNNIFMNSDPLKEPPLKEPCPDSHNEA